MRNWPQTLRPASFRGVAFYVENEKVSEAGRHVATFEFLKTEDSDTEDMGRKALKLSVAGYLVGDTADSDAQALIAACSKEGEASLILPFMGQLTARCLKASSTFEKDKLGRIPVDLEFVEASRRNSGDAGVRDISTQLAGFALSAIPGLLSAGFADAGFEGAIAGTATPAANASADLISSPGGVALAVSSILSFGRSIDQIVLPLLSDSTRREKLQARADALISLTPRIRPTNDVALAAAAESISILRDAVEFSAPIDAVVFMAQLGADVRPVAVSLSPSVTAKQQAAEAFKSLFRLVCITEQALAQVKSGTSPSAANDADRERAARFFPGEVIASIDIARGHIMTEAANGPLGIVSKSQLTSSRYYPSVALGWSLYADPSRGEEITALNSSGTAFALPSVLQVVTPEAA